MYQRADQRNLEAQNMRNLKVKIRNDFSTSQTVGRPHSQFATRNSQSRLGFTLTEVLIVVAIIALLAAGLVGVSNYVQTQGNVALTEQCVKLLSTAVAQFHDITGHYPIDNWTDSQDGASHSYSRILNANRSGTPNSDELLYLQLSLLPQTREIISKLPEKLLAAPAGTVQLAGQSSPTPYLRSVVDPWHTDNDPRPLNYERDTTDPDGVFPRIWSNGPDGKSSTDAEKADDITNED